MEHANYFGGKCVLTFRSMHTYKLKSLCTPENIDHEILKFFFRGGGRNNENEIFAGWITWESDALVGNQSD